MSEKGKDFKKLIKILFFVFCYIFRNFNFKEIIPNYRGREIRNKNFLPFYVDRVRSLGRFKLDLLGFTSLLVFRYPTL